jgi:hypothetical protein
MAKFCKPMVTATLLAVLYSPAFGGCICPDLTKLHTGDLQVAGATIEAQKWVVHENHVEVYLKLVEIQKSFRVEVLGWGMLPEEYVSMVKLAALNGTQADAPNVKSLAEGITLSPFETKKSRNGSFEEIRLSARLKESSPVAQKATVKLEWNLPSAGADEPPQNNKEVVEDACIDAEVMRGLVVKKTKRSRYDGFLRVDLRLSDTMEQAMTLQIVRTQGPISLCAKQVRKIGKDQFEVSGRTNLIGKNNVLPIMFAKTI